MSILTHYMPMIQKTIVVYFSHQIFAITVKCLILFFLFFCSQQTDVYTTQRPLRDISLFYFWLCGGRGAFTSPFEHEDMHYIAHV